jgi:predicted GNAT family acetyltransferase
MVKKFEDDNIKQNEDAFLRSKDMEAYKSNLSKSEYENEKLKLESNNHKDMINLLTINKEREISDINNFYNTTVQEHSKLLNKVETDQKDMIGN